MRTTQFPLQTRSNPTPSNPYHKSLGSSKSSSSSSSIDPMNSSKETERINEKGELERTVETVDHRSPPGGKEPQTEKVEVTHVTRTDVDPGRGGAVVEAAAKVAEKIESAKEAITGHHHKDD